jgi:hypothetical protein
MEYRVSFVALGDEHPGGIQTLDHRPTVGDEWVVGGLRFEIVEVKDLFPPYGEIAYLHATCRRIEQTGSGKGTDGDHS